MKKVIITGDSPMPKAIKAIVDNLPNVLIVTPTKDVTKKSIAEAVLPITIIGLTVTPNSKDYWTLPLNPEKKALVIDDTKVVNLGTACEKTLMYHFEGDPPRKWEIASQFSKPK